MRDFPITRRLLSLLPSPRQVLARAHPLLKIQLRHIPFPLQQRVMEKIMAEGFREALQTGALDFLQGRWLRIEISDLQLRWHITKGVDGPVMINSAVQPDVVIRGTLRDFVALANQSEDPDTLFFQRRLSISGNTDLGLQVKNLMFATELNGLAGMLSRALETLLQFSPSQFSAPSR
jgi:O2-independent ubiquinone biosynthesis accessory factor UbiT